MLESSGFSKNWKKVKRVSETELSAMDLFNVFILSCVSRWQYSDLLERNYPRTIFSKLLIKYRQTSSIVFIVCRFTADQITPTRPHKWNSILRLTCQALTKQTERLKDAGHSRTGSHNTPSRQSSKISRKKCSPTKSSSNPRKEPHTENHTEITIQKIMIFTSLFICNWILELIIGLMDGSIF